MLQEEKDVQLKEIKFKFWINKEIKRETLREIRLFKRAL